MIRSLKSIKAVATVLLLTLPMLAIGQNQSGAVFFIDEGTPDMPMRTYYHAIPGRFFIQRSPDVNQDYIISLLDDLTDSPFETSWCSTKDNQDNLCRVIIDDTSIDNIIDELLKDNGVLVARRIYVNEKAYNDYVYFLQESGAEFMDYIDYILKSTEIWVFNNIMCTPMNLKPESVPIDSICEAIGLTYDMIGSVLINFKASKDSDIFEVAHRIFETGYFTRVAPDIIAPYSNMEKDFGDLTGSYVNKTDHYFIYSNDGSKKYYYEIPDRFYVCKNEEFTCTHIDSLLISSIDCKYEVRWIDINQCEVIVDDVSTDSIIGELIKDKGVSYALHIYVSKDDYEEYLYYPYLETHEVCFLPQIIIGIDEDSDRTGINNYCEDLGLIIDRDNGTNIILKAPKNADMFEVWQKLYNAEWFKGYWQFPEFKFNMFWSNVLHLSADNKETVFYYDLSGHRVDSPSGLTIVVTRYSDGSARQEKRFYK